MSVPTSIPADVLFGSSAISALYNWGSLLGVIAVNPITQLHLLPRSRIRRFLRFNMQVLMPETLMTVLIHYFHIGNICTQEGRNNRELEKNA
jgi:hypothetical protein